MSQTEHFRALAGQQARIHTCAAVSGAATPTLTVFTWRLKRLIVCLSHWLPALQAWPVRKHDNDGAVKHLQPIACMLFNSAYQEVISADEGGTICVWKVSVSAANDAWGCSHQAWCTPGRAGQLPSSSWPSLSRHSCTS